MDMDCISSRLTYYGIECLSSRGCVRLGIFLQIVECWYATSLGRTKLDFPLLLWAEFEEIFRSWRQLCAIWNLRLWWHTEMLFANGIHYLNNLVFQVTCLEDFSVVNLEGVANTDIPLNCAVEEVLQEDFNHFLLGNRVRWIPLIVSSQPHSFIVFRRALLCNLQCPDYQRVTSS